MRSKHGFALLEVLIALAIIALALTALSLRMQSIIFTTAKIEDKTVAYWIAENKLQELVAQQQLGEQVTKLRRDKDVLSYAGRDWHWQVDIEEVALPEILAPAKMFRADIHVGLSEDQPVASLSGFLNE